MLVAIVMVMLMVMMMVMIGCESRDDDREDDLQLSGRVEKAGFLDRLSDVPWHAALLHYLLGARQRDRMQ